MFEILNDSNGKKITERTSVTFSKWTFVIRASHSFTLPGQNAGVTEPRGCEICSTLASRLLIDDWVQITFFGKLMSPNKEITACLQTHSFQSWDLPVAAAGLIWVSETQKANGALVLVK